MKNKKLTALFEILVIVILFLVLAYFVDRNISFFEKFLGKNLLGFVVYTFIVIVAIVIAPVSSIPLLPVVSKIWGWQLAAGVSVIGWTIGSIFAFILSRKYGVSIVEKLIHLEELYKIENRIPEKHLFLSVLLLRMVVPVDILSYALGLFSKIKFWPYTIATFIGVIPATIILAYVGTIPFAYQVLVILVTGIVITSGVIIKCRGGRCLN